MTRADVIQRFLDLFDHPAYLEVGVNQGATFHALRAERKVAVDPRFLFEESERETASGVEYHEVISDEYFATASPHTPFDVIFIDGLHTSGQTLRDFMSALLLLKPQGVIVIDDVVPNSYDASLPSFPQVARLRELTAGSPILWAADGSWMGDVYKLPFFINMFMQQLSLSTVVESFGQAVVWRSPRKAAVLPQPDLDAIVRLDFRDTILRRSDYDIRPLAEIIADIKKDFGITPPPSASHDETPASVALPVEALTGWVEAPGQRLQPPTVYNFELAPPDVATIMSSVWEAGRAGQTVTFHRLKDVYVIGEGLVFDKDLRLYKETVHSHDQLAVAGAFANLKGAVNGGSVTRHDGAGMLCGKIGLSNYGHWMVESLPLAFLNRKKIINDGWKVYVPMVYPWMAAVIRDSLSLLGIEPSSRIEGNGGAVWFEELVVVTGLTKSDQYFLPATTDCFSEISRQVPSADAERVWMSRIGERRSVVQEVELCEELQSMGWTIAAPGKLPLREQIAISKGAKHMAGVNGAGLTNMGFMPSGGRVTSFIPANMPDIFYWHLANNRDLQFEEVRCVIEPPTDWPIKWDAPLQIDIADVKKHLTRT